MIAWIRAKDYYEEEGFDLTDVRQNEQLREFIDKLIERNVEFECEFTKGDNK